MGSNATYYNEKDRSTFKKGWLGQAHREMRQREGTVVPGFVQGSSSDLIWEYDTKQEELAVALPNERAPRRWHAVSGPHGNGTLPFGSYSLGETMRDKNPNNPKHKAFCDPVSNCWSKPIIPDFETQRDNFAMHPDGNIPGTLGCIGLTDHDTKEVYNILKQYPTGKVLVK